MSVALISILRFIAIENCIVLRNSQTMVMNNHIRARDLLLGLKCLFADEHYCIT